MAVAVEWQCSTAMLTRLARAVSFPDCLQKDGALRSGVRPSEAVELDAHATRASRFSLRQGPVANSHRRQLCNRREGVKPALKGAPLESLGPARGALAAAADQNYRERSGESHSEDRGKHTQGERCGERYLARAHSSDLTWEKRTVRWAAVACAPPVAAIALAETEVIT